MTRGARFTVKVRGDRELRAALKRLGPRFEKAVAEATARTALRIEEDAKRRAPANFGHLRSVIRTRFNEAQTLAEVGVFEGATAGGHQVNYAPYVELGTRGQPRKFPPLAPLILWARRKLGDARLAWPVALKIYQRGTPAQPFLKPAFDTHAPKYRDELTKAIRDELGREP